VVLQKTTEVGVAHVRLYQADNSPHALKKDRVEHKLSRWNDILLAACEQSGRPAPPTLSLYESLSEALVDTPQPIFVGAEEGDVLKQFSQNACTYVVGPEGGLTTEEQELLAVAERVHFGPYTLRSETASIVGIAQLLLR
jgi:16S rRNA (uracil1498-N3)-methyltransferase